jgi:flagellin
MAISVNTNVGSLTAQRAAASVNSSMETSMERLASGKRINAAKDDAAGVAIASRLTAEVRGTNQAIRNALDAQAFIDTAEGAHEEIVNLLQRMREVGVQAANDTNNSADRAALQAELVSLSAEIGRIAKVSTWAGKSLAMSNGASFKFQIGSQTASTSDATKFVNTISVTIGGIAVTKLSVNTAKILTTTVTNALGTVAKIDRAIATVNTQRAKLGSYSNRLESTVSNLSNISTNLSAGLGRVQDADFASETTNLARSQILQQAAMAMLAQANASKQGVLTLLQR